MSNRVYLDLTVFTTVDENGQERDKSFGYRLYDDYGAVYNNTYDSIEAAHDEIQDKGIMEVIRSHEEFKDIDGDTCSGVYYNDEEVPEEIVMGFDPEDLEE